MPWGRGRQSWRAPHINYMLTGIGGLAKPAAVGWAPGQGVSFCIARDRFGEDERSGGIVVRLASFLYHWTSIPGVIPAAVACLHAGAPAAEDVKG